MSSPKGIGLACPVWRSIYQATLAGGIGQWQTSLGFGHRKDQFASVIYGKVELKGMKICVFISFDTKAACTYTAKIASTHRQHNRQKRSPQRESDTNSRLDQFFGSFEQYIRCG